VEQIKCVVLNINEDRLMLPNSALIEIVPIRNIINVANKPRWMLGYLDWRGNSVPLVAFETMTGVRMPSLANADVRAAVLYSVSEDKQFPFMAILVQGAPRVLTIVEEDIVVNKEKFSHPAIDSRVMAKGEMVSIVNLEKLEAVIKTVMTH